MSKKDVYICEYVKKRLRTDPKWALHALEIVAANQTTHELDVEETTEQNGIGFNGRDAKILTSFAKQYENRVIRAGTKNYVKLTPNQMVALHKMISKYWKQVVNASNPIKLEALVAKDEIEYLNKYPDEKLPLLIGTKWIFESTRVEFLKRLKSEQLVLNL